MNKQMYMNAVIQYNTTTSLYPYRIQMGLIDELGKLLQTYRS